MIKLIIKERGYILNLRGMSPIRTPAKIDVTRSDLNYIITELRRMGIQNFVIKYGSDEQIIKEVEETTFKIEKDQDKEEQIHKSPDLNGIYKRLDSIESLLQGISAGREIIEKRIIIDGEKEKSKFVEPEEAFIPTVDTSGLSLKGKTFKQEESSEDVKDKSRKLSKIIGKKEE